MDTKITCEECLHKSYCDKKDKSENCETAEHYICHDCKAPICNGRDKKEHFCGNKFYK